MSKIYSNFNSFNISFSTNINKKKTLKWALDNEAHRRLLIIFYLLNTRSQLFWVADKVSTCCMVAYKLE